MLEVADISDIELKQRWRLYWIQSVFEFSNLRLQRMSWIEASEVSWPDEPWESSFEACNDAYFESLDLYDQYEKAVERTYVTPDEAEHAKSFHQLALAYIEPDDDPVLILGDETWLEVVEAAKEFWEYLKTHVDAPREKELIKKLENEFPL